MMTWLKALMVLMEFVSMTGETEVNFENGTTATRIMLLSFFVLGSLSQKSIYNFSMGRFGTVEARYPQDVWYSAQVYLLHKSNKIAPYK